MEAVSAAAAAKRAAAALLLLPLLLLVMATGCAAQQPRMNPLSEALVRGLAQSLAAATPSVQAADAADANAGAGAANVGDTAGGLGPVLCDTLDCPNFKVCDVTTSNVEKAEIRHSLKDSARWARGSVRRD
jgi:hypothetical protein